MGQELIIVPTGLYTDPSPHGAAPPGALRTATNVVLRRQGTVEPRPGFAQHRARPLVDLAQVHAILGYTGTNAVLYVGDAKSVHTTYLVDEVAGTSVAVGKDDTGLPLPWIRGHIQAAAIRKNLYLSTADAVRKITGPTDDSATKIGTPPCFISISVGASPGTAVPAGKSVSYRAVVARKDPNGLFVRSAPSNRVIFKNISASTVNVTVVCNISTQDDSPGGETIELYRSLAQDNIPFDEHFFAKSITRGLNSTITDDVAETDLGAPLYTNEDEEGAGNANIRPPAAKDVCEFNGSLFLANLTYPAQLAVHWNNNAALLATDSAGVGQRTLTGTFTNGSAVVTGVASTVGFRVGQVIDDGSNEWAGTTDLPRIISLTGTSVTFSANYTGTTGSKSKAVFDSIRVNNQYFPVGSTSWSSAVRSFWDSGMFGTHTPSTDVYALTDDLTTVLSSGLLQEPNFRTLLLKAINATSSPFVVYATHGSEYSPPLPEPTAGAGVTADQDVFPSAVAWSKTLEPEHFSLADMELIGSDRADTWRIKKGRDALWVLKTEGLWRLSGAGRDSGFRIDPVSKAKLITPNCLADIFDQVYAWTDQGILALDSGANAVASHPVRDQLMTLQGLAGRFVTLYDTWLCSNQKAHELILCVQDPGFGEINYLLVYNFLTEAWTRWDLTKPPSCGNNPLGPLIFGIREPLLEGGTTYVTTKEGESLHDSVYTVNVTNVTGTSVTIASGSGWLPAVGDSLEDPVLGFQPSGFIVNTVTDETHFTVGYAGLTTGTKRALVAYESAIEPVACTSKNPSILKLWGDGSILWGSLIYIQTYSIEFRSSRFLGSSAATVPKTVQLSFPPRPGCSQRFITPRSHARTEQLFVKVRVKQSAGADPSFVWSWQGLSLFYSAMGPRVAAR